MNRREALFSISSLVGAFTIAPKLSAKELNNVPLATRLSADAVPVPAMQGGYRVLTSETDRKNLAAVCDRLIPADDHGPSASQEGAIELSMTSWPALTAPVPHCISTGRCVPKMKKKSWAARSS